MAVTPPTPLQKRVFTLHNKCCFQLSVYMCEKPASLVYQDRKRLQDKPITAQNNRMARGKKRTVIKHIVEHTGT